MTESMRVVTEGDTKGAWLDVPSGMICLVNETDRLQYVGAYAGKPVVDGNVKLPYALSFDRDGHVMVQLPGDKPGDDVVIVRADKIRDLVLSAKKL